MSFSASDFSHHRILLSGPWASLALLAQRHAQPFGVWTLGISRSPHISRWIWRPGSSLHGLWLEGSAPFAPPLEFLRDLISQSPETSCLSLWVDPFSQEHSRASILFDRFCESSLPASFPLRLSEPLEDPSFESSLASILYDEDGFPLSLRDDASKADALCLEAFGFADLGLWDQAFEAAARALRWLPSWQALSLSPELALARWLALADRSIAFEALSLRFPSLTASLDADAFPLEPHLCAPPALSGSPSLGCAIQALRGDLSWDPDRRKHFSARAFSWLNALAERDPDSALRLLHSSQSAPLDAASWRGALLRSTPALRPLLLSVWRSRADAESSFDRLFPLDFLRPIPAHYDLVVAEIFEQLAPLSYCYRALEIPDISSAARSAMERRILQQEGSDGSSRKSSRL